MSLMNDVEKHKRMYNLTQHMENVYTLLTPDDIESKWQSVMELVPKRDQSLQMELAKQMNHERLRVEFANLANKVGPWITDKTNVWLAFNNFSAPIYKSSFFNRKQLVWRSTSQDHSKTTSPV